MTQTPAKPCGGAQGGDVAALRDHLPHYRTALTMHTHALSEAAEATRTRDQAADELADAQARAQAQADADLPREARAAALHLATLPALLPYRTARDRHTAAAAELERTRVLERGEREILRTFRTLLMCGGEV